MVTMSNTTFHTVCSSRDSLCHSMCTSMAKICETSWRHWNSSSWSYQVSVAISLGKGTELGTSYGLWISTVMTNITWNLTYITRSDLTFPTQDLHQFRLSTSTPLDTECVNNHAFSNTTCYPANGSILSVSARHRLNALHKLMTRRINNGTIHRPYLPCTRRSTLTSST